jgi:putative intracellular protease/amidase
MQGRVLIALPDRDFDPTEVVMPWGKIRKAGGEPVFATEHGEIGSCDPKLLTGVIFGQLGAKPENVALYHEAAGTPAFKQPLRWSDVRAADYEALVLPGGHAPGMKQYLESKLLQTVALEFARAGKPIAAICHGVVVLARALDPRTGKSVIYGKKR